MASYLRDPWNFEHIVEFLSPSFHHPTALFFEIMLVLAGGRGLLALVERAGSPSRCCCLLWAHAALLAGAQYSASSRSWRPRRWRPLWRLAGAAAGNGTWPAGSAARRRSSTAWRPETGETEAVARWHLASVAGVLLVAA